jgi:putative aldouronate transport system permease protein
MKKGILKQIKSSWVLYLMLFPALLYFSIFHVVPLIGMKLAFQDYRIIGDNLGRMEAF